MRREQRAAMMIVGISILTILGVTAAVVTIATAFVS